MMNVKFSETELNFKTGFFTNGSTMSPDFANTQSVDNFLNSSRIGYVTLLADRWVGENSVYSQEVNIEGATRFSLVDLQPSVEQLLIFHQKDLAFTTENNDGVITVFVVGDKPVNDYTIQVTLVEVSV